MPDRQRVVITGVRIPFWSWLLIAGLATLGGCGDSPTAPTLDTSAHHEPVHDFGNNVIATYSWRFVSLGDGGVRGSYLIEWVNGNLDFVEAFYQFQFQDAGGFELARGGSFNISVPASGREEFAGTFTLDDVITVGSANEIERMRVVASFFFPQHRLRQNRQ